MAQVLLVIDTHVHVRTCFPKKDYFDVAWTNAVSGAAGHSGDLPVLPVLMLTESFSEHAFAAIAAGAGPVGSPQMLAEWGGWHASRTEDAVSIFLDKGDRRMLLVSGRQIDTGEGLEVSVLGVAEHIPDHLPIDEILRRADAAGGLSVIPWAPGKWFFQRGQKLHALLDRRRDGDFYLGDNGGRPWLWPLPKHLRRARREGVPILPGSDPLPFPEEMLRVARFGVMLQADLDVERPGEHMKRLLRERAAELRPYGALASPAAFLAKELKMQLTKSRRKRPTAGVGG